MQPLKARSGQELHGSLCRKPLATLSALLARAHCVNVYVHRSGQMRLSSVLRITNRTCGHRHSQVTFVVDSSCGVADVGNAGNRFPTAAVHSELGIKACARCCKLCMWLRLGSAEALQPQSRWRACTIPAQPHLETSPLCRYSSIKDNRHVPLSLAEALNDRD